jgi:signal peptidase I
MKKWIRENKGFVVFLALFGLFRTAVADWNPIPSGSMHPNLLEGDVVFVNRLAFNVKVPLTDVVIAETGEPQRGDVVTFSSPKDGTRLIKRVIALPGDVVEIRKGALVINGVKSEYEVVGKSYETLASGDAVESVRLSEKIGNAMHEVQFLPQVDVNRSFGPVTVPAGQFMMLGDNRDNSQDSRVIGLVPRELLIGRAERVLVSADIRGNWMPRTDRFGMPLH